MRVDLPDGYYLLPGDGKDSTAPNDRDFLNYSARGPYCAAIKDGEIIDVVLADLMGSLPIRDRDPRHDRINFAISVWGIHPVELLTKYLPIVDEWAEELIVSI